MIRRTEFFVSRIKSVTVLGNGKKFEVLVETGFSESGSLRCIIFKEKVDLVRDWIGKSATFSVNFTAHEINNRLQNDIIIRDVVQHDVPLPYPTNLW